MVGLSGRKSIWFVWQEINLVCLAGNQFGLSGGKSIWFVCREINLICLAGNLFDFSGKKLIGFSSAICGLPRRREPSRKILLGVDSPQP